MTHRNVSDLGAPGLEELRLDHVLAAIEDPVRRRILAQMLDDAVKQRDVKEYHADEFTANCSDDDLRRHLANLRYAGWIRQRVGESALFARLRYSELGLRFPSLISMLTVRAWGDDHDTSTPAERVESALLDLTYQSR